jgi:hypothetical protein
MNIERQMKIPTQEEIQVYVATRQAAMEKAGIDPTTVEYRLDDIYTKMFDLAGMLALLLEYHGIRRFHDE